MIDLAALTKELGDALEAGNAEGEAKISRFPVLKIRTGKEKPLILQRFHAFPVFPAPNKSICLIRQICAETRRMTAAKVARVARVSLSLRNGKYGKYGKSV